ETATSGVGEPLPPGFTRRRVGELQLADRVLAPSSFARDSHIAEGIDPQRLVLAPLGVDTDVFSPQRENYTEDGRFRVLFVGRITRFKGVEHLLRAFRQAAIPGSELLLVRDRSAAE